MSECIEHSLGPEAIPYIRDVLLNGHSLSKFLSQDPDLGAGRLTTFLPPDVSAEQLRSFDVGGVLPVPPQSEWRHIHGQDGRRQTLVPIPNTDSYLVSLVHGYLAADPDRICIFENFGAEPHYPFVKKLQSRLLMHANEVYHVVLGGHVEPDRIQISLTESRSIPFFTGALTSQPDAHRVLAGRDWLSAEQLRALAKSTDRIIIGAYDGEGYLIWSRPPGGRTNRAASSGRLPN